MSPVVGEVNDGAGQLPHCMPSPVPEFAGVHRSDGFFPVSEVRVSSLPPPGGLSRGTRQRISRRRQVQCRVNETISSLNHMTHTESKADGDGVFGDALRARLHRLHSVNVPEENLPKSQEALRELLGSAASVYAGAKCTVQPYVRDLVSWPAVGFEPRPIQDLLESLLSEEICGLHSTFVEKPATVRARRRLEPAPRIYKDPAFKDRAAYVSFINEPMVRGLLRFGTTSRERISAFCLLRRRAIVCG